MGCPILIGDGLKGTDDIEVPVVGGEYVQAAKIGRADDGRGRVHQPTHFKGHEMTGFGGAIKNIGMGCGSRAGKTEQHSGGKASIDPAKPRVPEMFEGVRQRRAQLRCQDQKRRG